MLLSCRVAVKVGRSDTPCLYKAAYSCDWGGCISHSEILWSLHPARPWRPSCVCPRAKRASPFCSDCRDSGPAGTGSRTSVLGGGWENTWATELSCVRAGRPPEGHSVFLWEEARRVGEAHKENGEAWSLLPVNLEQHLYELQGSNS